MALAALCGTSGNYIGEIEMGRRIPSFEKIEKIASALRISAYQLFLQETTGEHADNEQKTKDFLDILPYDIKEEITFHLLDAIHNVIGEAFDPKNY
jgi:transcriptional regulator with XRE-family HTH domain